MYIPTKEVVKRLFCLLKFKSWRIGKIIRIIEFITLTHRVFPQESGLEKKIYPKTFKVIAAASNKIDSPINTPAQEVYP